MEINNDIDQQRLQSAYDYARTAVETSQLSEAAALVREFRSSDAYQWAQGSRTTSISGFDSSWRETVERQTTSDRAFSQARELSRTAQFMREWGSGAQTDFTNYAARRLSERGLLHEEDPARLQRAVSEIAFAYAKGGDVNNQFVPGDNPLKPSQPLPRLLGWTSSGLQENFETNELPGGSETLQSQAATNNATVQALQSRRHVHPVQNVGNDIALEVESERARTAEALDRQRHNISQEQGVRSEDYNESVNSDRIRPDHGGNRAVWDTVGIQADNRTRLGTPPEKRTIGEWHLSKDGVPVPTASAETQNSGNVPPQARK